MNQFVIRRAVVADFAQAYDIWYNIEAAEEPNPPPRMGIPTVYEHELKTGEMYVAEKQGQVVGFAAVRGSTRNSGRNGHRLSGT